MKKVFYILVSLLLSCNLMAQKIKYTEYDLVLGPMIGIQTSTMSSLGGDYKFGPVVGVDLEFFVTPSFSLGFNSYWTQAGTRNVTKKKVSYNGTDIGSYDVNTHYIYTNYQFKYYVTPRIGVFTGINIGFLTGAKINSKETGKIDVKDYLSGRDLSIPIGVSYNFNQSLGLSLRYNIGLKKIGENSSGSDSGTILLDNARNQQIMMTAYYHFSVM